MICRLCGREADDVRVSVVSVRFVSPKKRWGHMALPRCRDRAACRLRWNDQGKGAWPLIEADLPAPHWLTEVVS